MTNEQYHQHRGLASCSHHYVVGSNPMLKHCLWTVQARLFGPIFFEAFSTPMVKSLRAKTKPENVAQLDELRKGMKVGCCNY